MNLWISVLYFILWFLPISYTKTYSNPSWSFAVLSDTHIGDSQSEFLLEEAIKAINALKEERNLQFVFITGDVTTNALDKQWERSRQLLDKLNVIYIPTIGNHDQWSYNSSWEETFPTGDAKFAKTFMDKFTQPGVTFYNNVSTHNPIENITSWYQNWEFRAGNLLFLSCDWNSRHAAAWELGYKGSMPGAQLHEFPGGTLSFLEERLKVVPDEIEKIVFLQHHPYKAPWYIPGYIYSFSEGQQEIIRNVLQKYQPIERYWGVIAGHFHMWWNSTAFDVWPTFLQWETDACKVTSAFTLVTVENNQLVKFEKMYGINDEEVKARIVKESQKLFPF